MRLCLNCYMYLSKLQCVFVLIDKCICPNKQLEQVLGAEYSVERRGVEGQHWAAGSNKSLCFCPTCSTTFWTSAVGLVLEITRTCLGPWDWVHSVIREFWINLARVWVNREFGPTWEYDPLVLSPYTRLVQSSSSRSVDRLSARGLSHCTTIWPPHLRTGTRKKYF